MNLLKQFIASSVFVYLAIAYSDDLFACGDGKTIPLSWICDNVKDCQNGIDEFACQYLHRCPAYTFMCRSGECLPANFKCNGAPDCSDGSDERSCHTMEHEVLPSAEEFERALNHLTMNFTTTTELPTTTKSKEDFPYVRIVEETTKHTVKSEPPLKVDVMHIRIAKLEAQASVIFWILIILVIVQILFLLSLIIFCFWPAFRDCVKRLCCLNVYKINETTTNP